MNITAWGLPPARPAPRTGGREVTRVRGHPPSCAACRDSRGSSSVSWVTRSCVCVAPRCPQVMGLEERAETLCCVRDGTASAPCPNLYPEAPARHGTVFGSGDFGMQAGLDEVMRAWGSVPG